MAAGAFAAIARKGHPEAGILIVKVVAGDGSALAYIETFSDKADIAWRALADEFKPEMEIDTLIKRESNFDPDLWIVEVQDREGRPFLDGIA